jgi:lipopolysaccharide/colanic/teichoic acid biosynthesis glycosyltransferase
MLYKQYIKRGIDIVLSLIILTFLLPFLLIIATSILLESKGPVLFKQYRVGKGLEIFQVFKFRTMTNEKREVGSVPLIGKVEGVTNLGYILRRFKIDELPQLFNVLKGDMSLIGPRPSIPGQLAKMTERERQRYAVRPGVTGLAQVNGNIHLAWTERYVHDLNYIENISFANDVKILFRTIFIIVLGEKKFLNKPLSI